MRKNICVILPVLSSLNSILYELLELSRLGNNVIVLTSKSVGLKGKGSLPDYEIIDDVKIFRVVNKTTNSNCYIRKINEVRKILDDFKPNIIYFGTRHLLKAALKISKIYDSKLIMLTEFFTDDKRFIGRKRYYLKINNLAPIVAYFLRKYVLAKVDIIILANITEEEEINSKLKNKIYIIPWCNHINDVNKLMKWGIDKRKSKAIFAGELTDITINKYFVQAVESLLTNNIVKSIVIIGHGERENVIKSLINKYPDKVLYMGNKSREFVLNEISESLIAINTTKNGGWGFIGECFALGTPITYRFNHYDFLNKVDSIEFIPDKNENILFLKRLLNNEELYIEMQKNEVNRYLKNHTAEIIARKINIIFDKVFNI